MILTAFGASIVKISSVDAVEGQDDDGALTTTALDAAKLKNRLRPAGRDVP